VFVAPRQPAVAPWTVALSLFGHVGLVVAVVVAEHILPHDPPAPLVQPVVMLDLVSALPKQQGLMVDKPSRTPDPPQGGPPEPAPEPPAPAPPAEPPKPDQLVIKDPKAPPKPDPDAKKADPPKDPKPAKVEKPPEKPPEKEVGKPVDRTRDRAELLRQAAKEQALKDMTAPLGAEDRVRTSPDGVDPSQAVLGPGGAMNDPVYAAYYNKVRPLVLDKWTVIESDRVAHPNAVVVLALKIAADGTLTDPKVLKSSGVAAIDKAALMAIYKLARLPAPPAKYAAGWAAGTTFTLRMSDK
jgi:TonB family protein